MSGLFLDDWQLAWLDGAMGERADGSWAAAEVAGIASRQNGKNGTVEARELFGLAILGEWIIHTSHLFTTTKESYGRLLSLIEADPDVKNTLVHNVASPASGYEMRFRGGGRIKFIARSRASGRGLTGDLLVIDEAQDLSDDSLGALLPVISARPNAQTWYQGSAPGPESIVWHRIRRRGRKGGDPRLAYFEFSADPNSSLDDRDAWAQANPALGIRISEEAIQAERGAMSDELFARERLSISPDLVEGLPSVFPDGAWARVCGEFSQPTRNLVFALDVNPDRSSASIAVAGDGGVVGVLDHLPGVGWAVDETIRVATSHDAVVVIASAGAAAALIPDLERAGVTVVAAPVKHVRDACGAFYDAVLEQKVAVGQHPALELAVRSAVQKPSGDAWVWDRRSGDVSPLVAVTLAYFEAASDGPSVYEDRPLRVLG